VEGGVDVLGNWSGEGRREGVGRSGTDGRLWSWVVGTVVVVVVVVTNEEEGVEEEDGTGIWMGARDGGRLSTGTGAGAGGKGVGDGIGTEKTG